MEHYKKQAINDRMLSLHIPYPNPCALCVMINSRHALVPTALLFNMGMSGDKNGSVLSLMV